MTDREVSRLEWMGDGSWGSHHVSCCWILGTPDLGSSGSGRRRRFQTIWDQALHKWSRECNQSPQLLLGSVEAEENSAPTAPSVTQNTWVSASSGWNPSIQAQTSIRSDQQTTLWPDLITGSWLSPGETQSTVLTLKFKHHSFLKLTYFTKFYNSPRVFSDWDF